MKELISSLYVTKNESPLAKAHALAWERFLELELPEKRLGRFENYGKAPLGQMKNVAHDSFLLVLNGRYRPELSETKQLPKEMIVMPLSKAWPTFGNFLFSRFAEGMKKEQDPFTALNGALCEEGIFIYLPPHTQCKIPLRVIFQTQALHSLVFPRLHIVLGKGASLDIYLQDINEGDYFQSGCLDVMLEESSCLNITSLTSCVETFHTTSLRATLKRMSQLKMVQVTTGGTFYQHDAEVKLMGEGAEATLKGMTHVTQHRQGHFQLKMEHLAPYTRSLQKFKNVLSDFAKTSFEGKIVVADVAQKTEAFQMNPNLLLSERAYAISKPNLEIFADDVKASHGSTMGQIDGEHLFYLKARGIDEESAKRLLVYGFCKEILDEIDDLALQQEASSFVQS